MITYHPAYDLNHCAFRFITILSDIDEHEVQWDTLQILDFYFLFPHLLTDIRLPKNNITTKQNLSKIPNSYESLPNPRRLMFTLRGLQNDATRALVAKGIIDRDLYLKNIIKLYAEKVPENLNEQISKNEKRNATWYQLLVKFLAKYPVNGKDGLKDRCSLMEFRYDAS